MDAVGHVAQRRTAHELVDGLDGVRNGGSVDETAVRLDGETNEVVEPSLAHGLRQSHGLRQGGQDAGHEEIHRVVSELFCLPAVKFQGFFRGKTTFSRVSISATAHQATDVHFPGRLPLQLSQQRHVVGNHCVTVRKVLRPLPVDSAGGGSEQDGEVVGGGNVNVLLPETF